MHTDSKENLIGQRSLMVEYVAIDTLTPHPENPRQHSKNQIRKLAKNIQAFGFRIPVLIDEGSRLICGHGRVEACKQLGIKKVPALRITDLNENQIRAFMIADNRLSEISSWDEVLLGKNLKIVSDLEIDLNFDIESLGFDYGDLEFRIREAESAEDPSNERLPPDPPTVPTSRPGDLWRLNNGQVEHRVLCADATAAASYEQLLGPRQAALVFTDPPYNVSARHIGRVCAEKHGSFAMAAGEMTKEEFTTFLSRVMEQLCRFSIHGSIHYLCMDWRHAHEMLNAGLTHYSELKNMCVWVKDVAGMGSFYRSQHELVFAFKRGDAAHLNNFLLGQHGRTRTNVWRYASARNSRADDGDPSGREALEVHPTIKPVRLIEDALLDCSRRGEIVLDPFLGSGSTVIACEKSKRRCYGMELDPRYVDVVVKRWQDFTGKVATHAETDQTFAEVAAERKDGGSLP